jgi:hypothetical protein
MVNGGQVFLGNLPEVRRMCFGDNQGMPFGNGVDVLKGQDPVIFIDLETGDVPCHDLTKYTIFHIFSPLFLNLERALKAQTSPLNCIGTL